MNSSEVKEKNKSTRLQKKVASLCSELEQQQKEREVLDDMNKNLESTEKTPHPCESVPNTTATMQRGGRQTERTHQVGGGMDNEHVDPLPRGWSNLTEWDDGMWDDIDEMVSRVRSSGFPFLAD